MAKWGAVAMLVVALVGGIWAGPMEHFEVNLVNKLGKDEMFNAQCTFKGKPLGVYSVAFNDSAHWSLGVYGDEIFGCSLYWQNKYVEDAQVFVQTQQGRFCTKDSPRTCVWEIRPDGVYFLHAGAPATAERVFAWTE